MKQLPIVLLLTFLLLLAACTSGDRQQRLAQLEELERQNVADSLMTNDSLAQALADFFDRHGTPNERLRAHYILGRTYSDLGDAPRALTSYQDAVKSADTTASDCDYAKLSRVYGWINEGLHRKHRPFHTIRLEGGRHASSSHGKGTQGTGLRQNENARFGSGLVRRSFQ